MMKKSCPSFMHIVGCFSASMDVQNTSQHCLQQYGYSMTNYFPGAANVRILTIHTHLQLDVGPWRPRAWHMVHPFYCQPDIATECQLIILGGNAHIKGDSGDREDIADLRILTFGKYIKVSVVCSEWLNILCPSWQKPPICHSMAQNDQGITPLVVQCLVLYLHLVK